MRTDEITRSSPAARIFLIGTPDHDNLGDHAIAIAELAFLRDYFPETEIIEITGEHFKAEARRIRKIVKHDDVVLITGGGFLGNLWMSEEQIVRLALRSFPDNRIVIFPQTIFFKDNATKEKEYENTKRLYQQHPDLHIFVRDADSYDFMRHHMQGGYFSDCRPAPDMVTYLCPPPSSVQRNAILICLRKDKESILSDADAFEIEKTLPSQPHSIVHTDMLLNKKLTFENREKELSEKFDEFRRAKLVITDRLHAMLFAAVTETPCMAFNNVSGKVKGVHQWLMHLNYLHCVDSVDEFKRSFHHMMTLSTGSYDNRCFKDFYQDIASVISGGMSRQAHTTGERSDR